MTIINLYNAGNYASLEEAKESDDFYTIKLSENSCLDEVKHIIKITASVFGYAPEIDFDVEVLDIQEIGD